MVRAFVLISMATGHSRNLVVALQGRDGIESVDRVTGPYDVIAVLSAGDINGISGIVADEIHSLEGVVRTTTCVSME